MGQQGEYKPIGSPGDVQNINPWTESVFNRFEQMLPGAQAGMEDIAQRLMGADYDPEAAQNMFMSRIPGLRELVAESVRPYQGQAQSWAQLAADQARRDVAQNYSGGNLYSGAFADALGRGMAEPYMQAAMQTGQMRAGMEQDLFANTLQNLANQYSTGKQLETQNLAQAGDLYGRQFGAASQVMGQLAAPEWWQPTYVYEDTTPEWQKFAGGALQGGIMGLATGGLPGLAIGALGGGLGGMMGQDAGGYGYAGGMIGQGMGGGWSGEGANREFNWMGDLFSGGNAPGGGTPGVNAAQGFRQYPSYDYAETMMGGSLPTGFNNRYPSWDIYETAMGGGNARVPYSTPYPGYGNISPWDYYEMTLGY